MPLKLIIFDLDGTLVDTSKDIANALNSALGPVGVPALSVADVTALVGEGLTRLVEKVLSPERAGLRDGVVGVFLDYYSAHIADFSKPYPHVRETLEGLGGVKKAVLSNKKEALSIKLLDALGLLGHFDLVVGADTVAEKKPSPLPVRHVLDKMGAEAGEAVVVGDSNYDVEAAQAAGVKAVAVTYGYREKSMLARAEHMIEGMDELIPLLRSEGYLAERRRDRRYPVPDIYRKYISVEIKREGDALPARALGLSEHGLRLRTDIRLEPGSTYRCVLSAPKSLQKEIEATIKVRYCTEDEEGGYVVGAEIEKVESELWFKVLKNILRFIAERQGEVY